MANYRYVYEYNGKRYVIEAPEGATESDLQSIIESSPAPKAPPPPPKPQPKPKTTADASSYFPKGIGTPGFKTSGFNQPSAMPKGTTKKEIKTRYDLNRRYLPQEFQPTPNDGRPQTVVTNPTPGVIPLDQQTVDTLIDFENDQGYLDRLGSYYRQGLSPLESGTARLRGAVAEFEAENPLPWTSEESIARSRAIADAARRRAAQEEIIGNAPIAGGVGLENVVANPLDVTQYGEAFANLAATSLPYMFGAKLAPVLTTATLAGSMGQQRAENNMQRDAALRDIALASPGAIASMALERLGVERIIGAEGANAFTRALKAGAGEGVSETGSSLAEYTGSTLGTERGFSPEEAARQAGYGLLGGAILGGGLRGGYELGAKALGIEPAQRPAPPPPPPPAEGAIVPPAPPPTTPPAPEEAIVPPVPAPEPEGVPLPPVGAAEVVKSFGPIGGKITLQEPSGPQEYTYQGIDEDGSVLLADADGLIYAEDPDEVMAAMEPRSAAPEEDVAGMGFGMDVTEGLPPVEAAPAPVAEEQAPPVSPEPSAPARQFGETLKQTTGLNLPLAEGIPEQMKAMERTTTPRNIQLLESEARQIAADQGSEVVSSEHFAQALNNQATRTAGTEVPFAGDWRQATRPAPAPERIRTVTTPGGSKVNTAFEVVDAKDLTAASGDLQNRDRSRAATDLQVQDIFANFDPERLGESLESDRGSPIIGPDNVIESGNGRVMAINKVYNESPERADAYRKFIEAQGFDTAGMDRPVLVRRRIDDLTPEARSQFVRESNMDTKLQLSTSERAQTDAASLTPDVMALMASPDVSAASNRDFVRGFLSKLPTQEQAAFLDKNGQLSAEGIRRIRTAVKAAAYGDADLINTLDESQDNNIKSIGGALEDVAPAWRRFRDAVEDGTVAPEMDVTDKLIEAAKTVRDVRNQGMKIKDFLAQQDAFNPLDPVTEGFIRSFYNKAVSTAAGRDAIADVLDKYVRRASEQTTSEALFEREAMSPSDILNKILDERVEVKKKKQGKLFQSPAEPGPNLDSFSPEARDLITQAIKVPSLSRNIRNLLNQYYLTEIDEREFVVRVDDLLAYTQDMRGAKEFKKAIKGRARGADQIRSRLYAARRDGILSDEEVDFMIWALDQNPNLANELGISIRQPGREETAAGDYLYVQKVMRLFKGLTNDSTAVHEMLHHTERMMPEDVQEEIRKTWLREFNKAEKKAKPGSALAVYFTALRAAHSGSDFYVGNRVIKSDKAFEYAMNMFNHGNVPYSYYQYTKPSEFWAVNATDIMQKRYDVKDSTLARIRNWLSELVEKAKGLFNASPKAPLIKALDSLIKADGKFNSKSMLDQPNVYYMEGVEQTKKPDVKVKDNAQVMDVLANGSPEQMKKAVAAAQKPDDKIIQEGANLQKKNRGCD